MNSHAFTGATVRYARLLLFILALPAYPQSPLHLTHQYANVDAQSLIGLPMGNHKTIVTRDGSLQWSQWSLARKGKDVLFGFSAQLDGGLGIALSAQNGGVAKAFKVTGQTLDRGRYPFIVTNLVQGSITAQETAFAVADGGVLQDAVWIEVTNHGSSAATVEIRLSGKQRNLPAFASGSHLETHDGRLLATVTPEATSSADAVQAHGFQLIYHRSLPANESTSLLVRLPYDFTADEESSLAQREGPALLAAARQSWDEFWLKGARIELPASLKELADFYWSSLAYTLILTERDAKGELWTLDGPAIYREFWGRGEYFQGRAMEVGGYLGIGKETVAHTFSLQRDDGEWDWPETSGWPAWDNIGGNAASVWDYYLYSRDREWLVAGYPYMARAADWITLHREESMVPDDVPAAARPIRRQIPWKCSDEEEPALKMGEKHYWFGLLPWSYGDSGLPEGHPFPHNVWALYAIELAAKAAHELGKQEEAARYEAQYAAYNQAILRSMQRAIALETDDAPYLPAMPTFPQGGVSQSLIAVYPTGLFPADHPWVTNLLTRMRRTELQGLPTDMAWMGRGGVWPGESFNVAETYLRRGDVDKTVALLTAALNHSYTTNVFKEEIKVDKSLPVACKSGNAKNVDNGHGTGDMPEAWGNANLVLLVRDMLLREDGDTLHLLSGIPARWVGAGEAINVEAAPTTFGGSVSFRFQRVDPAHVTLHWESRVGVPALEVHIPLAPGQAIDSARTNGAPIPFAHGTITLTRPPATVDLEVTLR